MKCADRYRTDLRQRSESEKCIYCTPPLENVSYSFTHYGEYYTKILFALQGVKVKSCRVEHGRFFERKSLRDTQ